MATGVSFKTDLYSIFDYYQNTLLVHPKEMFIETLRQFFEQDSYYHYTKDEWGFPKTPDQTNLPLGSGLYDDSTTRLYIGEYWRLDTRFYPSILVKMQGSKYVPISMSRNKGVLAWRNQRYTDGYGNETVIATPDYFAQAGCWEGNISVDITTRSMRARDELVELVSILFTDLRLEDLEVAGIFIKGGANIGSPSEVDDRNDHLFKQSVSFEIRSEWERRIYVDSVIDAINVCVDLGNIQTNPGQFAPNLKISTFVDFIDSLTGL
jgi:hypothetical protein